MTEPVDVADQGPPRSGRWLVGVALVLLLVPGLIGFDAWPLTAWRLFSLSRTDHQTRWVLEAENAEGSTERVSLEELPLRYRHAEWPMAELPGASDRQRAAVCQALLEAVVDVRPDTVALAIQRDRQRLVAEDGDYVVTSDPEDEVTCKVDP